MDCDRFEATLIDELYEELDELTSAAAKRHVAGCSRCASLLGGLRATRRVAVLPIIEPSCGPRGPDPRRGARSAQRVTPVGWRLSRAVSWAGSWAMRPQTAMAAVFLLMVGSSLLFVRRSKVAAFELDRHRDRARARPRPPVRRRRRPRTSSRLHPSTRSRRPRPTAPMPERTAPPPPPATPPRPPRQAWPRPPPRAPPPPTRAPWP